MGGSPGGREPSGGWRRGRGRRYREGSRTTVRGLVLLVLVVERGGGLVVMVKRVVAVVERRSDLGDSARVEPVLDHRPQPDHEVGRVDDVAVTHELGIVEVELGWVRARGRSRIGVRVKAG